MVTSNINRTPTDWISLIGEATFESTSVFDDVWLILNYACDANCKFCYVNGLSPKFKTRKHIFDEIRQARRVSKGKRIGFSGGEPTLRKDIIEIMLFAKEINFEIVHIFTHGRKFADFSYSKAMVDAGLRGAMISMHGIQEKTNDFLMGSSGTNETWRGIQNLADLGVRIVVNFVVNRVNIDEMIPLYQRCAKITPPIYEFRVTYPSMQRAAMRNIDLVLPYESVLPKVEALILQSNDLLVGVECFPLCLVPINIQHSAEWRYREQVDYMPITDRVQNHHRRVWSLECVGCHNRFICTGVQEEHVRRFGTPTIRPSC